MKKNKYMLYRILRVIVKPIYTILYRPKRYNKQLVPKKGAIIVCGNHYHAFDQFNVMTSTNRILRYMAKKEYFDGEHSLFQATNPGKFSRWLSKWLVINSGMISVDRSIKDEEAKGAALEALANGEAIGIFPEGTRNKTKEWLLPFKFGAVSLAQKSGATIVPYAITGEYKIFKRNRLAIRFGEPFKVSPSEDLQIANEKLYNTISSLKKEGIDAIKNGKC